MASEGHRMLMSARLQTMVRHLERLYPSETIDAVLADADVKRQQRGGHSIIVEDWDDVLNDQPIEGGYRIVASPWVSGMLMLYGYDGDWEGFPESEQEGNDDEQR